jgi:hypothetical protein
VDDAHGVAETDGASVGGWLGGPWARDNVVVGVVVASFAVFSLLGRTGLLTQPQQQHKLPGGGESRQQPPPPPLDHWGLAPPCIRQGLEAAAGVAKSRHPQIGQQIQVWVQEQGLACVHVWAPMIL